MIKYSMYNANNIFNKIINKKIKCEILKENKNTIAIKDINPQSKTHILVIPKGNYSNLFEFNEHADKEEILSLWSLVNEIILEYNLKEKGFKILINQGEFGGQEIDHLHVHILG